MVLRFVRRAKPQSPHMYQAVRDPVSNLHFNACLSSIITSGTAWLNFTDASRSTTHPLASLFHTLHPTPWILDSTLQSPLPRYSFSPTILLYTLRYSIVLELAHLLCVSSRYCFHFPVSQHVPPHPSDPTPQSLKLYMYLNMLACHTPLTRDCFYYHDYYFYFMLFYYLFFNAKNLTSSAIIFLIPLKKFHLLGKY